MAHALAKAPDVAAMIMSGNIAAAAMIVQAKEATAMTIATPSDASPTVISNKQAKHAEAQTPPDTVARVPCMVMFEVFR